MSLSGIPFLHSSQQTNGERKSSAVFHLLLNSLVAVFHLSLVSNVKKPLFHFDYFTIFFIYAQSLRVINLITNSYGSMVTVEHCANVSSAHRWPLTPVLSSSGERFRRSRRARMRHSQRCGPCASGGVRSMVESHHWPTRSR